MNSTQLSTLIIRGADGTAVPTPPRNGADGLGGADGANGTTDPKKQKCTTSAQPGLPGHGGTGAPPASVGGNGQSPPLVTFTIAKLTGTGALTVTVLGGS